MRKFLIATWIGWVISPWAAIADESIPISSPGFRASTLDAQGRLIEDWGAVHVRLVGDGVTDEPLQLESCKLDDVIPAARATANRGPVGLTCVAFRAPTFPSGVDVLQVRVEEIHGQPCSVKLVLDLPEETSAGSRTVSLGGRTVLALSEKIINDQPLRDWGYDDQAVSLPNWARPIGDCDPAFRNIRAGMGGVPIVYHFQIPPRGQADLRLGFCESHWTTAGQRPLTCQVEGAPTETVDPIDRWGRHQPGIVSFAARDEDGDGRLTVVVKTSPTAQDANPILNAIWLFAPGKAPTDAQLLTGAGGSAALYVVDVGGKHDQSILPPAKLEYTVNLPAQGFREWTFLVAAPGGSAPHPSQTTWDPISLRRAARDVWRDWPEP